VCSKRPRSCYIGTEMTVTNRHRLTKSRFAAWVGLFVLATTAPNSLKSARAQDAPQRVRVYVTDSQSWEIIGGWGMSGNRNANGSGSISGSGYEAGGARPQTAEIIKTFNQRCPEITITNNVQRADFAVTLDHEGGKGYLRHRNKIVVFDREGDAIFSDSTRELGSSVADACQAIRSSPSKPAPAVSITPHSAPVTPSKADASVGGASATQPAINAEIEVASTPARAEIQLDGNFVGNTPSTIGVAAGYHTIAINKNGYKLWERKIRVNGGKVSVVAELETEEDASKKKTETAVASTPPASSSPSHDTSASPSETLVTVYFASEPGGAAINVDNASVGKAPMTLKLKPGPHAFRMFMNGYQNWGQWLTIQAGPDVHVTATLTKSN